MFTEKNAKESELASFINVDPLLQNMPNITLALFLLLEKNNPGKQIYLFLISSDHKLSQARLMVMQSL